MLELIKQPWHWAVAGTLIGLIVPLLLLMGNKKLGVSSSMRHLCAICMPNNISFFKYDWKKEIWNLFFVVGIFLGGFIAAQMPNISSVWMNNSQPYVGTITAQKIPMKVKINIY